MKEVTIMLITMIMCISGFLVINHTGIKTMDAFHKYYHSTEELLDKIPNSVIDSILISPEGDRYMECREELIHYLYEGK